MIGMFLKFSFCFVGCFIILSFNIADKPIFYHISELTGPIGQDIQNSFGKSIDRSVEKTKTISKGLWKGDQKTKSDSINTKKSSSSNSNSRRAAALEDLKKDEIKKLDQIIRNN